ncbi:MAG: hypothetical protein KF841_00725 [Phycisphaerae bacterium]|nr:hypothetical protein [Phycisphaerae bacterium]
MIQPQKTKTSELIPPSMRAAVDAYSAMLRQIAGDQIRGLTFFGPVLTPQFDFARMAAANVLILDRVELGLLRRIAERGPDFGSRGIAAPLIMTPEYIRDSLDSFPLELLEIHLRRVTVFGEDCFDQIRIQPEHLRLQCERELKRVLIRCRQALLEAAGREEILSEIEADIGLHLLRTLRGVLWLKGRKEFVPPDQLITLVEQTWSVPCAGLRDVVLAHGDLGWPEFQAFYANVETLAERIDA